MAKYKKLIEKGEVAHIRGWLAKLFGVQGTSVSRWIKLGNLKSYAAVHVLEFIEKNPRMLVHNSRNRRLRADAGIARPQKRKKSGAARSNAQKDRRLFKAIDPLAGREKPRKTTKALKKKKSR